MSRELFSMLGAVGAAFVASLCCSGPLLYVVLGVGGAGLSSAMEPWRPLFLGLTAALLAAGFYSVYGPGQRCADADHERTMQRRKTFLWAGTVLVFILATFPTWSTWLL